MSFCTPLSHDVKNFLHVYCSFLVMRAMSSAYRKIPMFVWLIGIPLLSKLTSSARLLMNKVNKVGERLPPCLTPEVHWNHSVCWSPKRKHDSVFWYYVLMLLLKWPSNPFLIRLYCSKSRSTVSINVTNVDSLFCIILTLANVIVIKIRHLGFILPFQFRSKNHASCL